MQKSKKEVSDMQKPKKEVSDMQSGDCNVKLTNLKVMIREPTKNEREREEEQASLDCRVKKWTGGNNW